MFAEARVARRRPTTKCTDMGRRSYDLGHSPKSTRKPLERVLCIEDEEDIQRIVQIALERFGSLFVRICDDSRLAFKAAADFKPDLILLDVMMPGLDGRVLFKQCRTRPETAQIPVVFLTALVGAAGIITKPFRPADLTGQLQQIWKSLA